jgi:hypothetical protein
LYYTAHNGYDDPQSRRLKAQAALSGRTIGELVNEALSSYLARPRPQLQPGSLADLTPEAYPDGTERLSEEIDRVVYGV